MTDLAKIAEQTTRTITRQLVESVEFLQALHHDIKAENVFFQSKHQDTILLGDFGLAKILQPQEKLHEVAGTLSYMAPEMLDYKIGYDFPIDVWALVCVFISCYVDICLLTVTMTKKQKMLFVTANTYSSLVSIGSMFLQKPKILY